VAVPLFEVEDERLDEVVASVDAFFPRRSHWTAGELGWEAVADDAIDWMIRHT
jgi:hypothetical protein